MKTRKPTPNTTADGQIACAFGEPWLGPHPLCQADTARICGVPIDEVLLPDFSRYAPSVADPPSINAIDPVDGVVAPGPTRGQGVLF